MGGRWDATNVLIPLVSVITHIDIDHTNYLGDTIASIAAEKAGIIKPGRPVVSAPQSETVMAVLKKQGESIVCSSEAVSMVNVDKVGSPVNVGQKLKIETPLRSLPPVNLPLLGECQRENCAVAVAALDILADMLRFEPEFKKGLEAVVWRARFQALETDPLTILDGAHNPSAARALVKTLKECCPKYDIGFVFGFLDDKDTVEFLRELKPLVSKAWTVSVNTPRGTTATHSAAQARAAGFDAVPVDVSVARDAAREWATAEPDRLVCITGSFYLVEALGKPGPLVFPTSGS
jgi:dihydrofolate synthase/folylpolyglutamate synthase